MRLYNEGGLSICNRTSKLLNVVDSERYSAELRLDIITIMSAGFYVSVWGCQCFDGWGGSEKIRSTQSLGMPDFW